jgi:hypothetical protein
VPDLSAAESFVGNFLAHYSSEFYDPVKAHEYYLKNRELKGGPATPAAKETPAQRKQRTATAANQRQALSYANNQISTKRQADLKGAQAAQKARTEAVRKNVEQRTAQIKQKLEQALAKLKADAAGAAKPVKLNEIPPNASPKVRAFLEAQNAKIKNEAAKEAATANKKLSTASAAAQKAASAEAQKLGNEMRTAITKARDDYAKSRQQITTKYKTAAVTERKNIQSQVR